MADISKEMALVIGAKHSTPTQFGREFSEAQWMAAVQDIAKLGRNSGLEEAAKVCTELAELNRKAMTDSMWQQEECATAIESLRGNTP